MRDYLNTKTRQHAGGTAVVVFDDVNIRLRAPSPPDAWNNPEDMQDDLHDQMGKSGQFFDMVMTMAHSAGAVVFVSTSKLLVAKYFQGLNAGTKAQTFKRCLRLTRLPVKSSDGPKKSALNSSVAGPSKSS